MSRESVPIGRDWLTDAVRHLRHDHPTVPLHRLRVLDIGCGEGQVAWAVARCGFDVTGLDRDPAVLARARERSGETSRSPHWVVGDGRDLPTEFTEAYDFVILWYVLHHMGAVSAGLSAAWRAVKPGGQLLLAEKVRQGPPDGDCRGRTLAVWLRAVAGVHPTAVDLSVERPARDLYALLDKPSGAGRLGAPPDRHRRRSETSTMVQDLAGMGGARGSDVVTLPTVQPCRGADCRPE